MGIQTRFPRWKFRADLIQHCEVPVSSCYPVGRGHWKQIPSTKSEGAVTIKKWVLILEIKIRTHRYTVPQRLSAEVGRFKMSPGTS